jgi:iron complex outermembrane receptor protein
MLHRYLAQFPIIRNTSLLVASSILINPLRAQVAQPSDSQRLTPIFVTGNPLKNAEGIQSVQAIEGDALLQESKSTIGETLNTISGVSSSYFGPNASRPIIRGMDGDRIKILNNSADLQDLSSLSNDHSVPSDALIVERIEILRGPSAIMYGGSAIGGIINLIDNRIPNTPMQGVSGRADLSWSSGNMENAGSVLLDAGTEKFAIHIDSFKRNSSDVYVPDNLACEKISGSSTSKRICNSANGANGYALGGSVFWDQGYLGLSANSYQSNYGTVAEADVTIKMKSDRYTVQGEIRHPLSFIENINTQISTTDYQHTEYLDNVGEAVFDKGVTEIRLFAKHRKWISPIGAVQGIWGLQTNQSVFSVAGEEAFMPSTKTNETSAYLIEELPQTWGNLSFGLRSENVKIIGNSFIGTDSTTIDATSNTFNPVSISLGALWQLNNEFKVTGHIAKTQRAPKDYELRANGLHVATNIVEIGAANLQTEKATQTDLGLSWEKGPHSASINYFINRFSNYIGLISNGASYDDNLNSGCGGGDGCYDGYSYTASAAEFKGWEISSNIRLVGNGALPSTSDGPTWDLKLRADTVAAKYIDSGTAIARIPPKRLGVNVVRMSGPWRLSLGFDANAAPTIGDNQKSTSAYTLWNAYLGYKNKIGSSEAIWYAKLDNLTDKLAYSATSILTTTVKESSDGRPSVPLPGRSLKLGLQVYF